MQRGYLVVLVWMSFLYNPLLASSSRTFEPVSRVYSTMTLPDIDHQMQTRSQGTLDYSHERKHFEAKYSSAKFNHKALFFGFHMMVDEHVKLELEGVDPRQNSGYSDWYWSISKALPILKTDLQAAKNILLRFLDESKLKHVVFYPFNLRVVGILRVLKLKSQISKVNDLQQGLDLMTSDFKKYPVPRVRALEYKFLQREDISQNACSICLDDSVSVEVKTDCGHLFHEKCLENWFQRQRSCPDCRQDSWPIEP